jgi:hypothetical protein
MRLQKILLLLPVLLLPVLLLAFPAGAQITHVYATGIYPDDVDAVQNAVDNGGNVILHGDFNFGTASWEEEAGGVVISKPDVTLMGAKGARISGGGKLIIAPGGWWFLCPIHVNAPGVKVSNLEIKGSPDTGILVYPPAGSEANKPITLLGNVIGSVWAPVFCLGTSSPLHIEGNTLLPGSPGSDSYSYGLLVYDSPGMVNIVNNRIIGVSAPLVFTMECDFVPRVKIIGNRSEGCAYGIQNYMCGTPDAAATVEIVGNSITERPLAIYGGYADIGLFFNIGRTDVKANVLRSNYDVPGAIPPWRHAGVWAASWVLDENGNQGENPPLNIIGNIIETIFPASTEYQGMGLWLGGMGNSGINNVTVEGNKISGVAWAGIFKSEWGEDNIFRANDLSGLTTSWAQIASWAPKTTISANKFGFSNFTPGVSTALELASNLEYPVAPLPPAVTECLLKMNDYRKTGLPGWGAGTSGCVHVFSYGDKGGVGAEVKNNTIREGVFPAGTGVAEQVLVEWSSLVHDNKILGPTAKVAVEPAIDLTAQFRVPSAEFLKAQKEQRLNNLFGAKMAKINAMKNIAQQPAIQNRSSLPANPMLLGNYPNPFNPSTTIKYQLAKPSIVRLSVYDMLGREMTVLVNERKDAGVHEVKFEAVGLSSGVYFYRLQAGSFVQTRQLLLLK